MSRHIPGDKLIYRDMQPHGPYLLVRVTKAGFAVLLDGKEYRQVPTTLIELEKP